MDRDALLAKLKEYKFYQTVDLGDGVKTPGLPTDPKQRQVLRFIEGLDLSGKRVLEIGCANGLFSFAAEKRGAEEIVAIDHTKRNVESLREVLVPHLGSKVDARHLNLFDMNPEEHGRFDVVIFGGVLYHLRYPFRGLQIVCDLMEDGGVMILETGMFEDFNTRAILFSPSPADSPQATRGGNACAFFNERALRENLDYFGFRIEEKVVTSAGWKRAVKKIVGSLPVSYPAISNIVLSCRYEAARENAYLKQFYEGRTE